MCGESKKVASPKYIFYGRPSISSGYVFSLPYDVQLPSTFFSSPFLPSVRSESRAISRSVTPVQRSHKPIRPYFSWDGRTVQCVNSVELNILLIVVLLLLALSALTKKEREGPSGNRVEKITAIRFPTLRRISLHTHTHTKHMHTHI